MGEVGECLLCAIRLDDVVLDEGAGGPSVDGEVAVARGVEAAGVVDGSMTSVRVCHCLNC